MAAKRLATRSATGISVARAKWTGQDTSAVTKGNVIHLKANLTILAPSLSAGIVLSRRLPRVDVRMSTWAFLLGLYSEKASDVEGGRMMRDVIALVLKAPVDHSVLVGDSCTDHSKFLGWYQ